jgi:hypothetical protein
VSAIVFLA